MEPNIFRYKFTQEFMISMHEFSKIHQYDDRQTFKISWDIWVEDNNEIVDGEIKRLKELSYVGNIKEKMFKSARYYFRKKSLVKKEEKKRRKYIGINKQILCVIDEDITHNMRLKIMKPSDHFEIFCKNNEELIKEEIKRINQTKISEPFTEEMIKDKIKKTYKNRYFIINSGVKKNKQEKEKEKEEEEEEPTEKGGAISQIPNLFHKTSFLNDYFTRTN